MSKKNRKSRQNKRHRKKTQSLHYHNSSVSNRNQSIIEYFASNYNNELMYDYDSEEVFEDSEDHWACDSEDSNSEESEQDREEETDFEELSETDQEIRQICDSLIYKYLIEKRCYKTAELLKVEREDFHTKYTLNCKCIHRFCKDEEISGCLFLKDSTVCCITAGSKHKRRKLDQSLINDYVAQCIRYNSCCFFGPEKIEEIVLPEKCLIQILSYLDFTTVQKVCTQVSKSWLELIRSSELSMEMKLPRIIQVSLILEQKDVNAFLHSWENLRVLHFSSGDEPGRAFVKCLKTHKSLEKIVIPCKIDLYEDGRSPRWV